MHFFFSPLSSPMPAFAALIKQTQKLLIVGLNLNEAQLSHCVTDARVQNNKKKNAAGLEKLLT